MSFSGDLTYKLLIMKRTITSLVTLAILIVPASASAQTSTNIQDLFGWKSSDKQLALPVTTVPVVKPEPPKPPVPVVYTVVAGDNLTKIGEAQNVEWQRLWAKNTQLKHPDVLAVGDQITVPFPDEQLSRDIPAAVALPATTPGVAPLRSYDAGNTYDYGYCTWYVKNRRGASIPNSLGNANTWYSRAYDAGMAVGPVPRAGAVGTTTRGSLGHVVYVESVNADGTITISEMNASAGWGKVNSRTANAGEFLYIY